MSATPRSPGRPLLFLTIPVGLLLASFALDGRAGQDPAAAPPHAAGDSCLRCHEPLVEMIARSVPHAPAAQGECTGCHAPHAARYEHMLNKRERALCFSCHADEVLSFQTGSVHTPIRKGECTGCHEVHGSEHSGLLVTEGNELCFTCHEHKLAQKAFTTVHEPFVEGECLDCHAAHNSPHESQLMSPADSLCRLCHEPTDENLVDAHQGIPVGGTRCLDCHDAHASTTGALLLPFTHEPFAEGMCDGCHLVDSDNPQVPVATGARLCKLCHREVPRPSDTLVHDPVAEGNCGACHVAHAGKVAKLLVAAPRQTCLKCHAEVEQRRKAARTAHPVRVENGSCTICHQPHSSTEEHMLTSGGIRTCLACHEDMRHGHPLGSDRIDPRTGEGITCVTCHDPHGTDFPYQLRGDQSRGLCLECHIGGGAAHGGDER